MEPAPDAGRTASVTYTKSFNALEVRSELPAHRLGRRKNRRPGAHRHSVIFRGEPPETTADSRFKVRLPARTAQQTGLDFGIRRMAEANDVDGYAVAWRPASRCAGRQ